MKILCIGDTVKFLKIRCIHTYLQLFYIFGVCVCVCVCMCARVCAAIAPMVTGARAAMAEHGNMAVQENFEAKADNASSIT